MPADPHIFTHVLDLHPGVHLHEVVIPVLVDEEFHRARVPVLVHRQQPACIAEHVLPRLAGQSRDGGRLDDLLVAALHRAIPVEQVHDVTPPVPQALHLDVAGAVDVLLHEAPTVPERVQGLVAREAEHGLQVPGGRHDAYAPTPPPHGRLDDDGERDAVGRVVYPSLGLPRRVERAIGTGDYRHVRFFRGRDGENATAMSGGRRKPRERSSTATASQKTMSMQ